MPRPSEETPLDGDAERHEAKETHGGCNSGRVSQIASHGSCLSKPLTPDCRPEST